MNCPISALSARETARWMVFSGGRAITGIASSFFTNFGGGDESAFFPEAETSRAKAASSEGERGGGEPPPAERILKTLVAGLGSECSKKNLILQNRNISLTK